MKRQFVDLDARIVRLQGASITDLFSSRGESYFRTLEARTLQQVVAAARGDLVVALGGGALLSPVNREIVAATGTLVYLSCAVVEIYRRLSRLTDRPLLASTLAKPVATRHETLERIRTLLSKRRPQYGQAAITCSTTSRSPQETARELYTKLGYR